MDEERDCYYILGLPPGASPTEIKAAYRRLAKLYHPDHDQSLDAEMKYKEIRVAYETLRDLHLVGGAGTESVTSPDYSERATWTSADWTTEYDVSNMRIPLEWKRLPSIFINSLKEMPIGVHFRGVFVLACAFRSCNVLHDPMQSYGRLIALFYITSWILFVFFRYYFSPSEWLFFTRIAAGILYGITLIALIACFYTIPRDSLIEIGIWATVSIWILLAHLDDLAYGRGG